MNFSKFRVIHPLCSKNLFKSFSFINSRLMSQVSHFLNYKEYGEPKDVLQLSKESLSELVENQVTVHWLLAPINPADINTIQGKYPSKPPLPAVPGNEGVGEIIAVGPNSKKFQIGDKVIPNINNLGTWRSHAVYNDENLIKISKDLDVAVASMLMVNPCTAYRMLKDFITLDKTDTVIQNGANSAVGQLVIQLCKEWNISTVNIVRDRPDIDRLKNQLMDIGASVVLTEAELRTTDIFKSKKLKKPKLALNCVCGKNALEVQRHLDNNGIMVTYGGMSREPLTIPASSLIFKNISFKGFWMTAWTKENLNSKDRFDMFEQLQNLFMSKKLKTPPYETVKLSDYEKVITNALNLDGKQGIKYILDMTNT